MYEDFLDNYCKHWGITKEEALKHKIVQEFLEEKRKIDSEMSQVRNGYDNDRQ